MKNCIKRCCAKDLLDSLDESSVDIIYTDPPFGTGDMQTMARKSHGDIVSKIQYCDKHDNYLDFLRPHVVQMHRVLKQTGSLYLHLDYRWVHYAKVMCDEIFGMDNFMNDIVWSYNFGGRGKDRWPTKHDNILLYAKEKGKHTFNWSDIDRIPYSAPAMQYVGRTKEEAEKRIAAGQVPTDVWSMSIVGTASKERIGYPNQKPIRLVERVIRASSNVGDIVVDPFAGSGTTGAASIKCGRNFIMCDESEEAFNVMKQRFSEYDNIDFIA